MGIHTVGCGSQASGAWREDSGPGDRIPGFGNGIPGFGNGTPGFRDGIPGFRDGIPRFGDGIPRSGGRIPRPGHKFGSLATGSANRISQQPQAFKRPSGHDLRLQLANTLMDDRPYLTHQGRYLLHLRLCLRIGLHRPYLLPDGLDPHRINSRL